MVQPTCNIVLSIFSLSFNISCNKTRVPNLLWWSCRYIWSFLSWIIAWLRLTLISDILTWFSLPRPYSIKHAFTMYSLQYIYDFQCLVLKVKSDNVISIWLVFVFVDSLHHHVVFVLVFLKVNDIDIFTLSLRIEKRSLAYFAFEFAAIDNRAIITLLYLHFVAHPSPQTVYVYVFDTSIAFARSDQSVAFALFTEKTDSTCFLTIFFASVETAILIQIRPIGNFWISETMDLLIFLLIAFLLFMVMNYIDSSDLQFDSTELKNISFLQSIAIE